MGHFRKNCISFLTTNTCNMCCSYCYLGEKKKPGEKDREIIDLEFAKRGLEDFFSQSDSRKIRYFGEGEPTLEFDIMQQIQTYAKELAGDDLYTELQTNGFFGKEVVEWVRKNVNIIWVSMDGIPLLHDHYRKDINGKSTSKILERNIKFLCGNGVTVGIRSTIGRMNINRQKENIDYFVSLGVKAIFADHLCLPVGNNGNRPELVDDLLVEVTPKVFADRFLEAKEYAEDKGIFYSNFLCVNFDESVDIACRAMIPSPHLTPNGYVSCCDMATRPDNRLRELIYGKYDKDTNRIIYFQDKIDKIRSRRKANIPECQSCEVIDNCAGGCLGEAINETGDFYKVKKSLCESTKYLFKRMKHSNNGLYKFIHP